MFSTIREFFSANLTFSNDDKKSETESLKLHRFELASAALMAELMLADQELNERESETFIQVLQDTYNLTQNEVHDIVSLARQEAREATSLYEFTRLINDNYGYDDKVKLIANMWRLAFADDRLDKYEESLIRRVADLLYVSHSDFIKTKLEVRQE